MKTPRMYAIAFAATTGLGAFVLFDNTQRCRSSEPANHLSPRGHGVYKQLDPNEGKPVHLPGLENIVLFGPDIISGSAPRTEEAFTTLARMGVETIISVDGAEPDLKSSGAYAMQYIHLPIGYSGTNRSRSLALAKAVKIARDKNPDAPVYIHCHHGKHRSASAAGVTSVMLGQLTPDQAISRMRVSGTAESYPGLYACVRSARPATRQELAAVPDQFPSVWKTTGLVKTMVAIDRHMDHLETIANAGWTTPESHPDLIPEAEASRLAVLFHGLSEDPECLARPNDFLDRIVASLNDSTKIEAELKRRPLDRAKLRSHFAALQTSCSTCHARYRN